MTNGRYLSDIQPTKLYRITYFNSSGKKIIETVTGQTALYIQASANFNNIRKCVPASPRQIDVYHKAKGL